MANTAKGKRINRHKLAVIQAYSIIALFVVFGIIAGFIWGRFTAPTKVETVTLTETLETPVYESDSLPAVSDVTYFDVPLSHSLQRYIYEICSDKGVPVTLIMAMIEHESGFNPEATSSTDDFGLMQINAINHEWLKEDFRCADMTDPSPVCPNCGHVYEIKQQATPKEIQQAKLQKIVEAYKAPAECRTLQELYAYQKKKGYKKGWVYHIAKERGWLR